ncbi:MAG: GatB/YqeY domain-containing protein [Flavobacteriia bacterium]|nr:GatB/YqeY domain-containing protein [Flavobacteriia bacterium]
MSISSTINDQIKQAMLAKDKDRLAALRDIKAKLLLEATSGGGAEVSDETAIKICLKLYKQRIETFDLYVQQGRQDLADEELVQAKVIEEFLPKQLSEQEIQEEIDQAIAQLDITGPQDMGKLMGHLSAKLSGKADGKVISSLVKARLN